MQTLILLGGASHLGKSTLGARLADALKVPHHRTDHLARHPGRPWPLAGIPPHVADHYARLTQSELLASVLAHYGSLGNRIHSLADAPGVLEGSAVLPQTAAAIAVERPWARPLMLIAAPGLIEARMLISSDHAQADADARRLIDAFLRLAEAMNALIAQESLRLGLPTLMVGQDLGEEAAFQAVMADTQLAGFSAR